MGQVGSTVVFRLQELSVVTRPPAPGLDWARDQSHL